MPQSVMAKYKQEGENIDYTPSSAKTAGEVVVQGGMVGVVPSDIPANALGSLSVGGIWELPKGTGAGKDILVGEKVYWNTTLFQAIQLASGSMPLAGVAIATAGTADAFVSVKLTPQGVQGT